MYLCLNCLKTYVSRPKKLTCTKCKSEPYTVVEIDDLFILPIKILNQKGYITTMCCSGHFGEYNFTHSIIDFKGIINFEKLPENYESRIDFVPYSQCTVTRLENRIQKDNDIDFQKELFANANRVIDWVNQLPNLDK